MSDKLETQCWICPYCFDDHSPGRDCKVSDLKEELDKLRIVQGPRVTCFKEYWEGPRARTREIWNAKSEEDKHLLTYLVGLSNANKDKDARLAEWENLWARATRFVLPGTYDTPDSIAKHIKELEAARAKSAPTHDQVLKVVEAWQQFWMNQTLDSEDTKRYRKRSSGIDANMRHDLAEKIMEILK